MAFRFSPAARNMSLKKIESDVSQLISHSKSIEIADDFKGFLVSL